MPLTKTILHEAPLLELTQRYPAFDALNHLQIEPQPWRRWQRNQGHTRSHDLQVVFLGKSGYGKSSIVNGLTGQSCMVTSDVAACTRTIQSVEYVIRPGYYLSLADLPGLGESHQRDQEYLELYQQILRMADVVVYLLRADCRDHAIDEAAFARLFPSTGRHAKVILALNGCDKIEPVQRRMTAAPDAAQLGNIRRKEASLRQWFPGCPDIVSCSAQTGWNLDSLAGQIINKLCQAEGVHMC